MMGGASAFDGGFATFKGWADIGFLVEVCLIPPLTLLLSGYEGTLFGLLLGTTALAIIQWRNWGGPSAPRSIPRNARLEGAGAAPRPGSDCPVRNESDVQSLKGG
jgi:hypothetical protein